ncbi:hypothetical protein PHMEG_00032061 [Phytophthora megakarya]|uniref:Uncharacterized protein n=1 Tax=Phytophthora megakarya TaxID=4795 RepID=A0A225UX58_9STRA|nr:hypothetical protein PHMEG_00032061 [Phytophthora megakarya]
MSFRITPPILFIGKCSPVHFFGRLFLFCLPQVHVRQFGQGLSASRIPEPTASVIRSTASDAKYPSLVCKSTNVVTVTASSRASPASCTAICTVCTRVNALFSLITSIVRTSRLR